MINIIKLNIIDSTDTSGDPMSYKELLQTALPILEVMVVKGENLRNPDHGHCPLCHARLGKHESDCPITLAKDLFPKVWEKLGI